MAAIRTSIVPFALFIAISSASAGQAVLEWAAPIEGDGTPAEGINGYQVHVGTAPGAYTRKIPVGNVLSYPVDGLQDGSTYYFAVSAQDAAGNESAPSNEMSKTVPLPVVRYTLGATAGTGGRISPSGNAIVDKGSSQGFSIAPDTGYTIQDVLVDGVSVGAVSSYTFTNVTANHNIAASFRIKYFTITASAGTGGAITPSGTLVNSFGTARTFTILPNSGFRVASVVVDGVSIGAVSTYTFSNISGSHTISATFTRKRIWKK